MDKPIIVIGSGGHAKVLINTLRLLGRHIIGITTLYDDEEKFGIKVIGNDEAILSYSSNEVELVNGIGSIGNNELRKKIFLEFKQEGYSFATVIHPSVILPLSFSTGEGSQIMAGSVLQPDTKIGVNTIINTKTAIDHDCTIGNHVHIAPGCTLSGHIVVEDDVHVGAGATIIQNIKIHRGAVIGAGSLVIRDIAANTLAYGVPSKEISSI